MRIRMVTVIQTTTSEAAQDIPLWTDKVLCREEEGKLLFQAYQSIRRQNDDNSDKNHHHNKDHSSKSNNHSTSIATPLVMIHGVTGIGKTCLARSLRDTVTVDGGYFCAGKFDQDPKPHDAVSTAFGSFCTQVLDQSPAIQQQVCDKLWEALGSEAPRLMRRIPKLHQLLQGVDSIDRQEPPESITNDPMAEPTMQGGGGSKAINRFKYLLRLFVQAVACPERPVVLFLDDLHWADESSLDLVWSLINDPPSSHGRRRGVLFLCTVRDDADTSLIDKQLSCLGRSVQLWKISLQPFTAHTTNLVLSQLLQTTEQQTQSLTAVVYGQTKGNMFFITEFLRLMREEQLLWYNKANHRWMWDEEEIRIEFDGIHDLVQKRIGTLSPETKNLLKLAACLGTQLHQDSLGYLMESPILKLLDEATDRGIFSIHQFVCLCPRWNQRCRVQSNSNAGPGTIPLHGGTTLVEGVSSRRVVPQQQQQHLHDCRTIALGQIPNALQSPRMQCRIQTLFASRSPRHATIQF